MSDFDPQSSRMARLIFGQVSAPGLALPVADFAAFLPPNPLQFYQLTSRAYMSDVDGAQADVEIFADVGNGLYKGSITTRIGDTTLENTLYAHEVGDSGFYRVDKLVVDGKAVDLTDIDAASTALNTFLAYKNSAMPNGGPVALFPRPDSPIAPAKAAPSNDQGRKWPPSSPSNGRHGH